jgi:hypothetical protein
MQNEDPSTHLPPLHRPEQQPPTPPSDGVHGFPAVRQALLSGWHLLPVQLPLQQTEESVQASLSAVQLVALLQTPRLVSHWRLQQSVATAHELPGPLQLATDDMHFLATGSHAFEQHWLSEVQAASVTVQTTFAPAVPGRPVPPFPPWPVEAVFTELLQLDSRRHAASTAAVTNEMKPGLILIPIQRSGPLRTAHRIRQSVGLEPTRPQLDG